MLQRPEACGLRLHEQVGKRLACAPDMQMLFVREDKQE
jgi:hypothetical protein